MTDLKPRSDERSAICSKYPGGVGTMCGLAGSLKRQEVMKSQKSFGLVPNDELTRREVMKEGAASDVSGRQR